MKILMIFFSLLLCEATLAQSSGVLQLNIEGLRSEKGQLRIALFDNPDAFPKEGQEYRLYIFPLRGKSADIRLIDLPLKEFALAVFHDENEDGVCNKNVLGVPTEGYGFSNNTFHRFRPPSFEEARFSVLKTDKLLIKIKN